MIRCACVHVSSGSYFSLVLKAGNLDYTSGLFNDDPHIPKIFINILPRADCRLQNCHMRRKKSFTTLRFKYFPSDLKKNLLKTLR